MSDGPQTVNISLSAADWQLVLQMLQQALAPYHRLAQVMAEMQKQAAPPPETALRSVPRS